jgi:hypothetical protein
MKTNQKSTKLSWLDIILIIISIILMLFMVFLPVFFEPHNPKYVKFYYFGIPIVLISLIPARLRIKYILLLILWALMLFLIYYGSTIKHY